MYLFEWLLTLYTKVLNLDIVCRIWDLMLAVEGPIVLYKAALAILSALKPELLAKDMSQILVLLRQVGNKITDEDAIIKQIRKVKVASWIQTEINKLGMNLLP